MDVTDVFPAGSRHVKRAHQARLLALATLLTGSTGLFAYILFATLGPIAFLIAALAGGVTVRKLVAAYRGHTSGGETEVPDDHSTFKEQVETVANDFGIPSPSIHIHDRPNFQFLIAGLTPNTSQLHTTTSTLDRLDEEVQQGLIAHELAHLKAGHTWIGNALTFPVLLIIFGIISSFTIASVRSILGLGLLPAASVESALKLTFIGGLYGVFHYTVAREREYIADTTAAEHLQDSDQYARALEDATELTEPTALSINIHPPLDSRIDTIRKVTDQSDS